MTTTSDGTVYVVVETGGNNGQVQVVNNGAERTIGNAGGVEGLVGAVVAGVLVVGGVMVLL